MIRDTDTAREMQARSAEARRKQPIELRRRATQDARAARWKFRRLGTRRHIKEASKLGGVQPTGENLLTDAPRIGYMAFPMKPRTIWMPEALWQEASKEASKRRGWKTSEFVRFCVERTLAEIHRKRKVGDDAIDGHANA